MDPAPAPAPRTGGEHTTRAYLDAGGRAPVHPAAREAFAAAEAEGWADPRRLHREGRRARLLLDGARQVFARALGCRTEEVRFTAGHTASLHAAVLATAHGRRRVGCAVTLGAVERAALHAAARHVADGAGSPPAPPVPVDRLGRIDLDAWATSVRSPGVALAALQHANGEVGTTQPLTEAHRSAQEAGVPLLVDAGASVGHVDVGDAWDLLAADPGDWGAPAGVGVLAVRSRVRATPPWPEDEDVWAPGGVSVPAAFGAAAALEAVLADREEQDARRRSLVALVRDRIAREVPDVDVVGDPEGRLPHVVTFSCLYVDGEALVTELDRRGFAVGSGSACTSSALEPSHVLAAMGVLTHGNVRVALPREVTEEQVLAFCDAVPDAVAQVRRMTGTEGL